MVAEAIALLLVVVGTLGVVLTLSWEEWWNRLNCRGRPGLFIGKGRHRP